MPYPVEIIPNSSKVFFRIHKNWIRAGKVNPGVFKEVGPDDKKSMSTDWDKYSTPNISLSRARNPEVTGIIHFIVDNLRSLNLNVTHSPIYCKCQSKDNRSHTDVNGKDKPIDDEIRLKLLYKFEWELYPKGIKINDD